MVRLHTLCLTEFMAIISFLLMLPALIVMGLPDFAGAQQTCHADGDVDQNGSITAADALLTFQYALSLNELNTCQLSIANVFSQPDSLDSTITASDALCIFQKALGLPSCLDTLPLDELEANRRQLESELAEARTALAATLDLIAIFETGNFTQPEERELALRTYQRVAREQESLIQTLEARLSDVYRELEKLGVAFEPPEQESVSERLPFPFSDPETDGILGQGNSLTPNADSDGRQMPIYYERKWWIRGEGHPYEVNKRRLFVGIQQVSQHIEGLAVIGYRDELEIRHGQLNDGVGRAIVVEYLEDTVEFGEVVRRFAASPKVRLIGSASEDEAKLVLAAVQFVNTALPASMRMRLQAPIPDSVQQSANTIHIEFLPHGALGGPGGTTYRRIADDGGIESASIQIDRGGYNTNGLAIRLLAHEILHALGIYGHVSSKFDTIMEEGKNSEPTLKAPLSYLYPVDREALQALYGGLESGDAPTDLGPWGDESWHLHGNAENVGFGVVLRNGYAEPWAYGYMPEGSLANNAVVTGTGRWVGHLLGFTPSTEPVVGDASLSVDLSTLQGDMEFSNLEHWLAGSVPGAPRTGIQWNNGTLSYDVQVRGNTFQQTGGDAGIMTGAFFGPEHQAMGGTLERDDLTAAFGGKR